MKQLISSRNIKVVLAVVLAITCINGIGLNLNDHPIQVPDGTSSPQSKTTSTSSIPDYTGLASVVLSDGSGELLLGLRYRRDGRNAGHDARGG